MTAKKLESIIKWSSAGLGVVAAVIFVIWAFANTEPGEMPWGPLVIVVVGLLAAGFLLGRTLLWLVQPFKEQTAGGGPAQPGQKRSR